MTEMSTRMFLDLPLALGGSVKPRVYEHVAPNWKSSVDSNDNNALGSTGEFKRFEGRNGIDHPANPPVRPSNDTPRSRRHEGKAREMTVRS